MKEAGNILGVSVKTLQRWDAQDKIKITRTPGGMRRVPQSEVERLLGSPIEERSSERVLGVYARVFSHEQKQKGDLARQVEYIKMKLKGIPIDRIIVVTDVSSGLNDRRKGLFRLMNLARNKQITDIGITYKDRLSRFGFKYLGEFFESFGVKIHIVDGKKDNQSLQEELVDDLISIISSFSGRLYGIRSHKKKKFINSIERQLKDNG